MARDPFLNPSRYPFVTRFSTQSIPVYTYMSRTGDIRRDIERTTEIHSKRLRTLVKHKE